MSVAETEVNAAPSVLASVPQQREVDLLAAEINAARTKSLRDSIGKPSKREIMWFSDVHTCPRRNYYAMAHGDEKAMWNEDVQAKMNTGRELEAVTKRELSVLGYEPIKAQDVVEVKRGGRVIARGKMDFCLERGRKAYPTEHKAVQDMLYDAVNKWRDLFRSAWTEKYIRQLMLYLYGTNTEEGMFLLRSFTGRWKLLPVVLDYEYCEKVVSLLEQSVAAKEKGQPPERIPYSNELCGRCDFAHICIADIQADSRLKLVNNEEAAALLEVRDANLDAAAKCAKADKAIKKLLEGMPAGEYRVGNFIIIRTEGQTTKYDIPKEVKAPYAQKVPRFTTDIERFQKPDAESIYLKPERIITFDEAS